LSQPLLGFAQKSEERKIVGMRLRTGCYRLHRFRRSCGPANLPPAEDSLKDEPEQEQRNADSGPEQALVYQRVDIAGVEIGSSDPHQKGVKKQNE
jgi:hypothetical protein